MRREYPGTALGPNARALAETPGAKGRRKGPWVRLGLPEPRVFQAALPITSANHQQTPQNFFLEAVQATNLRAEDRIVELVKVEIAGRPLACVAAAPRSIVESSIELISRLARGSP